MNVNVDLMKENAIQMLCECKKHHVCEKDYTWNPSTCNYENGKYLASIIDHSTITFDEIIESYVKLSPKDTKLSPKDNNNKETKTTFNEEKSSL